MKNKVILGLLVGVFGYCQLSQSYAPSAEAIKYPTTYHLTNALKTLKAAQARQQCTIQYFNNLNDQGLLSSDTQSLLKIIVQNHEMPAADQKTFTNALRREHRRFTEQLKQAAAKLGDVKMGDVDHSNNHQQEQYVAPVKFTHYSAYSYGSFPRIVTPRSTIGITVPLSNQTTRKLPGGITFVIRAFKRLARR